MQDLLFLSLEPWDDIWRRNQFVCATLARRHPNAKILFVHPPHDRSNAVRRLDFRALSAPATPPTPLPDLPNLFRFTPAKLLPNSLAPARRFNESHLRRQVRRAAVALRLRNPLLWLNPHTAHHMVGRMHESATIYDITDDWTTLTQSPRLTALIQQQDAQLCRKADAVIVCSQKLHDLKHTLAKNLHLIPNGVDADHYVRIGSPDFAAAPATAAWPKPVFGYTGTIHPDRVDLDLLEALAAALKTGSHKGSLALVGPSHLPPESAARLTRHGNVFLPGPIPYRDIPAYMQAFDVCITPHRMTAFTESLNPIKLWEYLAAGKPIVSTDVAGFRDYPAHVTLARSANEFATAMQAALFEDPARSQARRAEARRHSWSARVDQIESIMRALAAAASTAPPSTERTPAHA
jgi:glycosyltransferase involved in cell wall biosynthesis